MQNDMMKNIQNLMIYKKNKNCINFGLEKVGLLYSMSPLKISINSNESLHD